MCVATIFFYFLCYCRTESSLTGDQNDETYAEDNLEDPTGFSLSENDETMETPPKQTSQTFTRQKRKKKEAVDDKLLQFLKNSEDSDRDDHKAFLISLLPTLRSFNECQTLTFRSEVLRIIMEIKNIPPYRSSSNASNQSGYWNPSSRNSSTGSHQILSPIRISPDHSNLPSPSSGDTRLSSRNDTNRPTLLQLCGSEFDELHMELTNNILTRH